MRSPDCSFDIKNNRYQEIYIKNRANGWTKRARVIANLRTELVRAFPDMV